MKYFCPEVDCDWEGTNQGLISHMRLKHGWKGDDFDKVREQGKKNLNPALAIPESLDEEKKIPQPAGNAKKLVIEGTKEGGPVMEGAKENTQKEEDFSCEGCGSTFSKPSKVSGSYYCPECGEELEYDG